MKTWQDLNQYIGRVATILNGFLQGMARVQAQEHINVGQPQIAVDQQHLFGLLGHVGGQVYRQRGLPDAALAAADAEDERA